MQTISQVGTDLDNDRLDLCLQGIRRLGGNKTHNLGEAAGVASFASELLPKARGTAHAQAIGNSPSGVLLFFDF